MIRSRRMGWAGHVARMREIKNENKILAENIKGREYLRYLLIDGRIILEWLKFSLKYVKQ
jgi:hypothetical protein